MAGLLMNAGATKTLDRVTAAWGNSVLIRLFENNHTPAVGDVLSTYTTATFPGYTDKTADNWVASTIVSGKATTTADAKTWTPSSASAGKVVYGYLLIDPDGTTILGAELDPNAPIDMALTTESYQVTPKFTLTHE